MGRRRDNGLSVFVSYSHLDERLRDELERHLAALKRNRLVDTWWDRKIVPGEDFESEIASQLEGADLILLLVSANFLSSDYCYCREFKKALDRHRRGLARVIPIILRPVDWLDTPLKNLVALPKDGKPITSWSQRDAALADTARGIRKAVEQIYADRPRFH
jgi:hypothetical protein